MASATASVYVDSPLSAMISKASSRKNAGCSYCGEILPAETFEYLAQNGGLLVDVRTVPEWQFVGVPTIEGCKGTLALISWKNYPDMSVNENFLTELEETGISKDAPIFFICRGGGRSSSAAEAMTQAGYTCCFNVATGFEGEGNASGHRGRVSGWQGAGLPWKH